MVERTDKNNNQLYALHFVRTPIRTLTLASSSPRIETIFFSKESVALSTRDAFCISGYRAWVTLAAE